MQLNPAKASDTMSSGPTLSQVIDALAAMGITVSCPINDLNGNAPDAGSVKFTQLVETLQTMGINFRTVNLEASNPTSDVATSGDIEEEAPTKRVVPSVSVTSKSPWISASSATAAVILAATAGDTLADITAAPAVPANVIQTAPTTPVAPAIRAEVPDDLVRDLAEALQQYVVLSASDAAQSNEAAATSNEADLGTTASVIAAAGPSTLINIANSAGVNGYVCQHCHKHNLIVSSKETWYTVTAGRAVGVYKGWHVVQPLVTGVAHACFRKYSSNAAASEAFEDALAQGLVVILT